MSGLAAIAGVCEPGCAAALGLRRCVGSRHGGARLLRVIGEREVENPLLVVRLELYAQREFRRQPAAGMGTSRILRSFVCTAVCAGLSETNGPASFPFASLFATWAEKPVTASGWVMSL